MLIREYARGLRRVRHVTVDWAAAQERSRGYDDAAIVSTVVAATLEARAAGLWERDGVVLDHPPWSWPVVSGVLWASALNNGRAAVMDFGGALGSTFWNHERVLATLSNLAWGVVEQESFVSSGMELGLDPRISFHRTIAECVESLAPSCAVLSSVLQYLPDPLGTLNEIARLGFKVVVVDRTPFWSGPHHYAFVQRVPATIYRATYPSWVFSQKRFLEEINGLFEVVSEFPSEDGGVRVVGHGRFSYGGFLLRPKN